MIYANSPKEAGDYLKTHYNFDKFLEGYLPKAKDGKTFVCPKCGTLIRKKEENILKGNNDPLFCPKCHSARLRYDMIYIT